MRTRNKLFVALGLALLVVSGAVADTAPAPAPAYPYGYVNPFDPNWWLATFNNLTKIYTVPGGTGYAAATAPLAGTPSTAPPSAAYPAGSVNVLDPNWWLTAMPTSAGPANQAATAPATGSAYVPVQTPYGPIHVFNYADPQAWNKLFAQPFTAPGQGTTR